MKLYSYIVMFLIILLVSCNSNSSEKNKLHKNLDKKERLSTENLHNIFNKNYTNVNELTPFKSFKETRGSLIDLGKKERQFGIQEIKGDNKTILLLEKLTYKDTLRPTFKILDTLEFKNLERNKYLIFCKCYQNNSLNKRIVSIVDTTGNPYPEYFKKIEKVWKINFQKGKFKEIKSPRNIKCANEDFGA